MEEIKRINQVELLNWKELERKKELKGGNLRETP